MKNVDTRLYDLLDIAPEASERSIKRAYHEKLDELESEDRKDDPDAESALQEVKTAYNILINETTRAIYDKHGQAGIDDYSFGFHNDPYEYHGKETIMSRLQKYVFDEDSAIKLQDWIPTLFDNQDMYDYIFEFWETFKEKANSRLGNLLFDFMNHTEGKSDLSFIGFTRHHISPKLQVITFTGEITGTISVHPKTELITIKHMVCAHIGLDLNDVTLTPVDETTVSVELAESTRPDMSMSKLLSLRLDPEFFFERLTDTSDPVYFKILKRLKQIEFAEQPQKMCDMQLTYYLETIRKSGAYDDELILSLVMEYCTSGISDIQSFIDYIDTTNYLPEDKRGFIAHAMVKRMNSGSITESAISIYMKTCRELDTDLMSRVLERIEKPAFDTLLKYIRERDAVASMCYALLQKHSLYSEYALMLFYECGEKINEILSVYIKEHKERNVQIDKYLVFIVKSCQVNRKTMIAIFKYVFEECQYFTKQDLMKLIKPFHEIMFSEEILPSIEFYTLIYRIVHVDPDYDSNYKFRKLFDKLEKIMKEDPRVHQHFSLILPIEVKFK